MNEPDAKWDWKLLLSVLLYLSIPPIYQSYSLYLIGNTPPQENNLTVIAQWQFIQVALEVFQEALVLPLFFLVGSRWQQGKATVFQGAQASFFLLAIILLPIMLFLYFRMSWFVEQINTDEGIRGGTIAFLRIKLASLFLGIINTGLIIVIESLRKRGMLLRLLTMKLLCSVTFDSWFFGGYDFSLSLGVIGLALSNLITELILLLAAVWHFYRFFGFSWQAYFKLPPLADFRIFRNIGKWVALESTIRNIAYFFMILQLLNTLGAKQIAGYYLAMHLFWGFALIPVNALAETMKALISNAAHQPIAIKAILRRGLVLGGGVVLCWLAALPMLGSILNFFSADTALIHHAGRAIGFLFMPYVLLAFNILIDTLFIGLGQTKYLAFQSLLTNLAVYGIASLLYLTGCWSPDFADILILFGIGIFMDSLLTAWYARLVLSRLEFA
jgi:Na+-driven multidrug efflux pump